MKASGDGLRVAARGVNHRDGVVHPVGGVERLGPRVKDDRLGVRSGVNLRWDERRASAWVAAATDVCVDDFQRIVLLVDDVDAVQGSIDGQPEGVVDSGCGNGYRAWRVGGAAG